MKNQTTNLTGGFSGGKAACFYNASEDIMRSPVLQGIAKDRAVDILFPDQSRQKVKSCGDGKVTLPDLPAWGECIIRW